MNAKTITIFGSSFPIKGSVEYKNAYQIAKMLAGNGFNICSGGAQGIMDAVSKGAKEEGREAIGITIDIFNTASSINLTREIKCNTLSQRLNTLIEHGDAFIILPGGTGTMLELSLLWEMFNKNLLSVKPTACLGSMWKTIVEAMDKRMEYESRTNGIIKCFNDPNTLVEFICKELT